MTENTINLFNQKTANLGTASRGIEKSYRTEKIWNVFDKYNTDSNKNELSKSEISAFSDAVRDAARSDNNADLSKAECQMLAKKLGVSLNSLVMAIQMVSADIIADKMEKAFHPVLSWFQSPDTTGAKELMSQINKNNVLEFDARYIQNTGTSLEAEILKNYDLREAKQLLSTFVSAIAQKAKDDNVDIQQYIKDYNTAIKANDKEQILYNIGKMLLALGANNRLDSVINAHLTKVGGTNNAVPTVAADASVKARAKLSGIENTDDLYGNGILGDTPSKALNHESKVILDALNELLKEPDARTILQACIKKSKFCIGIYNPYEDPNRRSNTPITEREIAGLTNNVIGDGDMTAMVTNIAIEAKIYEQESGKKITDMKGFIKEMFQIR